MAVATLERCYNNPKVFTSVVKIRKGETVRMIIMATNIDAVKAIFAHFVANVSINGSCCSIFMCESSYCFQHVLAMTILSVRLSVRPSTRPSLGWISQKRCKLGSPYLHHWLTGRL